MRLGPQRAWKLLDACWGAGNVCPKRTPKYERRFTPGWFSMDNAAFARRHFPSDAAQFHLPAGQRAPSWAEYLLGSPAEAGLPVTVYTGVGAEEGLDENTFAPRGRMLHPQHLGRTAVFEFRRVCAHWDPARHGQGRGEYLYVLQSSGGDLGGQTFFERDPRSGVWRCEVETRRLGEKGDTVALNAMNVFCGKDARGMTKSQFVNATGARSWAYKGVAQWEIA